MIIGVHRAEGRLGYWQMGPTLIGPLPKKKMLDWKKGVPWHVGENVFDRSAKTVISLSDKNIGFAVAPSVPTPFGPFQMTATANARAALVHSLARSLIHPFLIDVGLVQTDNYIYIYIYTHTCVYIYIYIERERLFPPPLFCPLSLPSARSSGGSSAFEQNNSLKPFVLKRNKQKKKYNNKTTEMGFVGLYVYLGAPLHVLVPLHVRPVCVV